MLDGPADSIANMNATVWTTEQEGQQLAKRFGSGVTQAEFARAHAVPGGASMVNQHIKGRRPMNLESAIAYARGFKVTLEEVSPRLALLVRVAAELSSDTGATRPQPIRKDFTDAEHSANEQVLLDLDALHPADRKVWVDELHIQAEKAREIGQRAIAAIKPTTTKKAKR